MLPVILEGWEGGEEGKGRGRGGVTDRHILNRKANFAVRVTRTITRERT